MTATSANGDSAVLCSISDRLRVEAPVGVVTHVRDELAHHKPAPSLFRRCGRL
jgi:hypothetical protein